jgi:uncharacterized Zn finger protein (UPF0148 family)
MNPGPTMIALHCPQCEKPFVPVSNAPTMIVQCPHCSVNVTVGTARRVDVAAPTSYAATYKTEAEENAQRDEQQRGRQFGRVMKLLGAGALLGVGLWAWQRSHEDAELKARAASIAELSANALATDAEDREIAGLVRRLLAAPTWSAMVPDVASAARVRPVMEWYYSHIPGGYSPIEVGEVDRVERLVVNDAEHLRVRLSTKNNPVVWCLLVKEGGVWKFDWEAFTNPGRARWAAFLNEPPGSMVTLRLYASFLPGADSQVVRVGGSPDSHHAIKLWSTDELQRAAVILSKKSPLLAELPGIAWDSAVKFIGQVTMLDPTAEPPIVTLDKVIHQGWIWRSE